MMSSIADLAIGVVELFETESQIVRRRITGMALSVGLKLGASLLIVAGLIWLVWAGFAQLSVMLEAPAAAAIMGLVTLLLAGGLLWASERQ
jgi:hypothetical protein